MGVKFQIDNIEGWKDIENPKFKCRLEMYRRKPKIIKHERVIVWYKSPDGSKDTHVNMFKSYMKADEYIQCLNLKELKRETVFCEVEE